MRYSIFYSCKKTPFKFGFYHLKTALSGHRPRKFHIVCFRVYTKTHSFHCSSSPHKVFQLYGDPGVFQAVLPFLKAVSPESLFVRSSLAVLNSSPMNPSLKSHVLIAYFGFSFCCGFGLAVFTVFAICESARQS